MKRSIHLFIGNLEADFSTVPDILYTFRVDDLTSPAAVRNTFSKTISLPGTPANNKIFGQYWASDRMTGSNFDATLKTPFTLYVDSEVYQTGYCKLDEVVQNLNSVIYTVSLFGGLGSFFSNLQNSENETGGDEKKKLSDLDFYTDSDSGTPAELGFTINKETVDEAWSEIDDPDSKWGIINFAPAYNGAPSDFDADKVLMNVGNTISGGTGNNPNMNYRPGRNTRGRGSVIVTAVTESATTYTTYGGYALAELSRDYTSSEMREFRSYLMRPCLSVRKTIEAICRPENNGGYRVALDEDWFNAGNCYWQNLFVTLPMLSTLEYNSSVVSTGTTVTTGEKETGSTTTGDPGYYEDVLAYLSDQDSGYSFDVNVKLSLDIQGVSNTTHDSMVVCAYSPTYGFYYASAVLVQLVAYDQAGNAVAGSDECYITSSYGYRRTGSTISAYFLPRSEFNYKAPYGNTFFSSRGTAFEKTTGSTYRWNEEISLTAKNVPAGSTMKILVTKVYKQGSSPSGSKTVFYRLSQGGQVNQYTAYTFNNFAVTVNSSTVSFKTNEGIRTGASFSKKQLLDTDYTPAEFLLSYAKIFGLYFVADPVEKKINILTRKNFFKRDEIVDIDRFIDRQDVKITPLVFDTKWYNWNLEADESEYGKAYENTYGKKYGQQLVNTNYNFNSDTTDVLEGNIFKNAVQVLERSTAYCYTDKDKTSKPWMFPGYKYLLYDTADATHTYEVEVGPSSTIDAFSGFTDGYLYYDLFDKVQLHSADNNPADGSNVLIMHDGSRDLTVGNVQLNYYITDDNSYMNILNQNKPCWLYTNSETDSQGNSIAKQILTVPYFSRYRIYTATGYITRSLDFGRPEEIYIPNAVYRENSTIYEQFWRSYIRDLYDKNTRVVTTKVYLREKPSVDWLRRFYWWDGSIYRMVAINDYSVAKDTLTEVEFVKVNDVSNYTSMDVTSGDTLLLTVSQDSVPYSGGSVEYTINTGDEDEWFVTFINSGTSVTATSGVGSYTGVWTIPANGGSSMLQNVMTVVSKDSSARVFVTQEGITLSLETLTSSYVSYLGGTAQFKLICPDSSWSASTDYGGIITAITPSSGVATDGSGVTITATFAPNDSQSMRSAYITVRTSSGAVMRSSYVSQQGTGNPYVELLPNFVYNYSYLGGTISVDVRSNTDWIAENHYPTVCYTNTTGGTGNKTIQVTVNPNTGGDRSGSIYFYFPNAQGQVAAIFTVAQLGYEEEPASGDTYFYFGTSYNETLQSATTVTWYQAGNIIEYKTNAQNVYYDIEDGDWIDSVTTGSTGAVVYTEDNRTGAVRTCTMRFGTEEGVYTHDLTITQEYYDPGD